MWYFEYCIKGVWHRNENAVSHEHAMRSLTATAVNVKGERLPVRAVFVCKG